MRGAGANTLALVAGVVAAALVGLAFLLSGLPDAHAVNILVVAVAYTSVALVPARLPRGDSVFGVVGVVVASVALLPASIVVAGSVLGSLLTVLLLSRDQSLDSVLVESFRQPAITAVVALFFPYLPAVKVPGSLLGSIPWEVVMVAIVYVVLDLLTGAVALATSSETGLGDAFSGMARLVGGMHAALASVGVVLAIVFPATGFVGGLILVTLMALMKLSFGMYMKARAAYPKTVGVLARLAEIEMQETQGHAERVAELATAVGKRMRLGSRAVERLGLAALLHDIGKVQTGVLHDDGEHALVGAEILEQIEFLNDLAPIVAGHHSTTAQMVGTDDELLAHIVYAVSYFDLRVQERSKDAVLQGMHELEGERFDPMVVKALGQVCC